MKFDQKIKNIVILGASFDSGNLGVSALAWSTIHLAKVRWPDANFALLGGREIKIDKLDMGGESLDIINYPVRYCKNFLAKNHIWKMWIAAALKSIFDFKLLSPREKKVSLFNSTAASNPQSTLSAVLSADLICDITGGDSFSDIYGIGRFLRGYLLKRICQMTSSPFVMLPQTYGPFKLPLVKWMAKRVLMKSAQINSRDIEGLSVAEELIGKSYKLRLCPDVAFTLEPATRKKVEEKSEEAKLLIKNISKHKSNNTLIVGLNVSGLLYSGGYTGKNEFGLKDDYRKLVREIVNYFTAQDNTHVLLIPHVVPEGWETENDLIACFKLHESLPDEIRQKVMIAQPGKNQTFFDQCEIKYLIGQCDFLMGSRMHATIAALSQGVPAIGLAYSKKFKGVFETVGVADCVLDLRQLRNEEILKGIKEKYACREKLRVELSNSMPETKNMVFHLFNGL
jgi:colanic acid/amylovoran biosynthesis protein